MHLFVYVCILARTRISYINIYNYFALNIKQWNELSDIHIYIYIYIFYRIYMVTQYISGSRTMDMSGHTYVLDHAHIVTSGGLHVGVF